jgi:hypothetical protein
MGLFMYRVGFDVASPSEEAVRAELTRQAGSEYGLED